MKRRIVTLLLVLSIATISITACGNKTSDNTYAELDTIEESTVASLDWTELGSLTTYSSLRAEWDSILGIKGSTGEKSGMLYKAWQGETQDSYLANVIGMQEFVDFASDESNYKALVDAVRTNFVDSDDLTDEQLFSIGLNAYFNLLPMKDESETYANEYVSRAQFLSLITRATNPVSVQDVDEFKNNADDLNNQIGDSIYNESVALSLSYSYLTLEDGSLNSDTYDAAVSRGEAIYTIMQLIYGEDELSRVDVDSAQNTFTDTTNGGDIATKNNLTSKAQVISYAIQNPDNGCPEDIYRALVKAQELGLIGSETAWDEAITLSDAVSLYYNTAVSVIASTTTSTSTTGNTTTDNSQVSSIPESENWPDYKKTADYYIASGQATESAMHVLNPDIYGTETAGKSTGDVPYDFIDISADIKKLDLTTTKGYYIEAYWYIEPNTVQFVYTGEVSPAGGWTTDPDSSDVLLDYEDARGGKAGGLLNITHEEKIQLLGEPSMTKDEVIAAMKVKYGME